MRGLDRSLKNVPLEEKRLRIRYLEGRYCCRRDRFTIWVEVDRRLLLAHLPNPGRLEELLNPGAKVLLAEKEGSKHKTPLELLFIASDGELVSIDSRLPNRIFGEAIKNQSLKEFQGWEVIQTEPRVNRSRLDFLLMNKVDKRRCYVEVKSCTLIRNGIALFPDALTVRGRRHVEELMKMCSLGFEASLVFIVQRRRAKSFKPNDDLDPKFGKAMREVYERGVRIYAYKAVITPKKYQITERIPTLLDDNVH